ncbi:MAG: acetylornithine deacetylase [Alphaproteobacteria bacterium]|nr:acetylornithine deacetylase [Alphaproteobacteria bacterium]
MTTAQNSVAFLERLVAHRTVSRDSNLGLIEDVRGYLAGLGIPARVVPNEDGTKANLVATIGPMVEGGLILSGHTDVVPVDGQPWSTDPFKLTEKDGKLYGRGASDMKGFIAVALGLAPEFAKLKLERPIHFCFSYDEEVGCFGAPHAIALFGRELPRASVCFVGEPTMMRVIVAHKGICSNIAHARGLEAHSSAPHLGSNAIVHMGRFLAFLDELQRELIEDGQKHAIPGIDFDPPYTTVGIGRIDGGTVVNIVPRDCHLNWELRPLPGVDAEAIYARAVAKAAEIDAAMKKESREAHFEVSKYAWIPACKPEHDGLAQKLACEMTGANTVSAVAFGTEAGQFQEAGISTVICGPGDIAVAHKTDEYTTRDQLAQCEAFLKKLARWAQNPR